MPKTSLKVKFLKFYEKNACFHLSMLNAFGKHDEEQRKKEDEILEELSFVMTLANDPEFAKSFEPKTKTHPLKFLTNILPHLDDKAFEKITRMSWTSFQFILDLIRNDSVFQEATTGKQYPIEMQLVIVLYRLGVCGEDASISNISSLFGIGHKGAIQSITNRVFQAIINLKTEYLKWPDEEERKNLVLENSSELPHCIGYVDCMLVKLSEKPLNDPLAYLTQQETYSLKVQGVCDHKMRIRHMVLGYPGGTDDGTIFKNCDLSTKANIFFSGEEWLAGKMAYKCTNTVMTPYQLEEYSNHPLLQQMQVFNKVLHHFRRRIKHCFALMKDRFNSLKELKLHIRNDSSIRQSCRWILVCAILHNILIEIDEDYYKLDLTNETNDDFEIDTMYINTEDDVDDESSIEAEVKRRALLEMINELHT